MVGLSLATDISSICGRCVDTVVVDSPWWVVSVPDLVNIGPPAIIGGFITYVVLVIKRGADAKARAERLAQSMKLELEQILELLASETRTAIRRDPYTTLEQLPTGVYDGLLTSAAISSFDTRLQDRLYRFYRHFKGKQMTEMSVSSETLVAEAYKVWKALDLYVKEQQTRFYPSFLRRQDRQVTPNP